MKIKYSTHPAMEVAWAAAMVFFGVFIARNYGSTKAIEPALMLLLGATFWFSMQRIVVEDDAIILFRRFGLFKRRIPLAQVSNVDANMVPGFRGANPTLYVYTADKRTFKVNLFSNDRNVQVVVDIRSRMNRLKNSRQIVDSPAIH